MQITNTNTLDIFLERFLPAKFKGTTFEKVIKSYLQFISNHQTLVDNFTNKIDLNKIDIKYSSTELLPYIKQYGNIVYDIINIKYPNLLLNGDFGDTIPANYWTINNVKGPTDTDSYHVQDYQFSYTNTNYNNYITLEQDYIKKIITKKYEVYLTVDSINVTGYSYIDVFFIKNLPVLHISAPGTYSVRIDENTLTSTDILPDTNVNSKKFIIKGNCSFTISNIQVKEYDRLTKDDIDILIKELSVNKGNVNSFKFLFQLLNNLGTDSATDSYMITNEYDITTQSPNIKVDVQEVSNGLNKNIRYGYNNGIIPYYHLNGQKIYDRGYAFTSNTSNNDLNAVVPFLYKIDATFPQIVYNKYIKPILHPTGWDVIYNLYSLNELVDAQINDILLSGTCNPIEGTTTVDLDILLSTADLNSYIGKYLYILEGNSQGLYKILSGTSGIVTKLVVDVSYVYNLHHYSTFFGSQGSTYNIVGERFYSKEYMKHYSDETLPSTDNIVLLSDIENIEQQDNQGIEIMPLQTSGPLKYGSGIRYAPGTGTELVYGGQSNGNVIVDDYLSIQVI